MGKAFTSFFAAIAIAGFLALGSIAATAEAQSIPAGSYQKTCRDIQASSTGITATCQKKDGSWQETSLSSAAFPCSEIENDDGDLVCTVAE